MGAESHRRHWETTWPVLNRGYVWLGSESRLRSGVTFCVPAPVYFLDLGQCLLDSIISTMQLGFVSHNQTQKAFGNPIQGAQFYLI